MASLWEQYEQAQITNTNISTSTSNSHSLSSGYVTVHLTEDTPIFHKQKMNLNPSDTITHFAISNDILVLAMANNKLFRIDLKQPNTQEEIPFGKNVSPNMKLSFLSTDSSGHHAVMCFKSGDGVTSELLYLHAKSSKLKPVNKAKNIAVTAVGWNLENTSENSTGPVLVGTSKGLIIETEIISDGDKMFQLGIEQYWKQVFDIGRGKEMPIMGIQWTQLPSTNKYYVFVVTAKRLYQFYGNTNSDEKPMLQTIFNHYLNKPETNYLEVSSAGNMSRLALYNPRGQQQPLSIAWLTDDGLYYQQLDSIFRGSSSVTDIKLLNTATDVELKPVSFILTEFHVLIVYKNHVKGISLLNNETVYDENFPDALGNFINIAMDPSRYTVWAITNKTVFRYKITREERNVWKIYMEKKEFQLAKKYCDSNPAYLDNINVKEAEFWFKKGNYVKSAEIFAGTQSSFERTCLKFLEIYEYDALRLFLERKLDTLKSEDMIQITMLIVWIIELYLSQISSFSSLDKFAHKQKCFEEFIMSPKVNECIKRNKSVIYELMASHGDKENLLKLTIINKDFENVIRQNIFKKSYKEALDVLKSQNKSNLFYQFISVLLQEIPVETVNTLIEQGKKLNPLKLLPALMSCEGSDVHIKQMIRYLEYVVEVEQCSQMAIHNYLLALYVAHDHDKLLHYLNQQGRRISQVQYDVHYALRLCRENNLTDACIQLSCLLELWESAVELALTVNEDLAKKIADMPEDVVLKKKLWLKIAHFVISRKEEVKEAMSFLNECDFIKIEDILPFFSDFDTIDHFREPICNSLQEYNQLIQYLHEEMEDATKAANTVRSEIQSFRNHCTVINVSEVCVLCEITLLLRPFYLFPCGHKFHADCLQQELKPLLGPAKSNRLQELQRLLQSASATQSKEEIKSDIDNIIASECLYCGEHMIQAIDTPFIPDNKWDQVIKEWE